MSNKIDELNWLIYNKEINKRQQEENERQLQLPIPEYYPEEKIKEEQSVEPRRVIIIDL